MTVLGAHGHWGGGGGGKLAAGEQAHNVQCGALSAAGCSQQADTATLALQHRDNVREGGRTGSQIMGRGGDGDGENTL